MVIIEPLINFHLAAKAHLGGIRFNEVTANYSRGLYLKSINLLKMISQTVLDFLCFMKNITFTF